MSQFWDERFAASEYIYGEKPNEYIRKSLENLKVGKILFPAEGEGRNSTYAAGLGWDVDAFDNSKEAKRKAGELAENKKVKINYWLEDILNPSIPAGTYDAVAVVFIHFHEEERIRVHQQLIDWLKPGGVLMMELFSKDQIKMSSGGPKDVDMLYTLDQLESDFKSLEIMKLEQQSVVLDEGPFHQGPAEVLRLLARKT